jgi:hypothetical protein
MVCDDVMRDRDGRSFRWIDRDFDDDNNNNDNNIILLMDGGPWSCLQPWTMSHEFESRHFSIDSIRLALKGTFEPEPTNNNTFKKSMQCNSNIIIKIHFRTIY